MNELSVEKKFGKIFKQKRNSIKISQEDLGKAFGLGQSAISKIEIGERESLHIRELYILRNQYSFDLNELFDDKVNYETSSSIEISATVKQLLESKDEIIALLKQRIKELEQD